MKAAIKERTDKTQKQTERPHPTQADRERVVHDALTILTSRLREPAR